VSSVQDESFRIRQVVPSEYAAVVLALFVRNNEDSTHPQHVFDEARCDLWIAERNGSVIGCLLGTHEYVRTDGTYAGIENLLVDAEHRRVGLGREFMNVSEAYYRAGSLAGVQLAADAENLIARRLYESLGYQVVREYQRVRDGRTEPRIQMVKTF